MRLSATAIRLSTLCVCFFSSLVAPGDLVQAVPSYPVTRVGLSDKEFTTTDGESVSLSDFHGSVVLLHFLASWCGSCAIEAPSLSQLSRKFQGRDFVVLGIAIDDSASDASNFAKTLRIPFPVLIDAQGALKRSFGAQGLPMTIVLNSSGEQISFQDPATGSMTRRIVGPRDWSSPRAQASIEKLLASPLSSSDAI